MASTAFTTGKSQGQGQGHEREGDDVDSVPPPLTDSEGSNCDSSLSDDSDCSNEDLEQAANAEEETNEHQRELAHQLDVGNQSFKRGQWAKAAEHYQNGRSLLKKQQALAIQLQLALPPTQQGQGGTFIKVLKGRDKE
jgi:hypothetical protein